MRISPSKRALLQVSMIPLKKPSEMRSSAKLSILGNNSSQTNEKAILKMMTPSTKRRKGDSKTVSPQLQQQRLEQVKCNACEKRNSRESEEHWSFRHHKSAKVSSRILSRWAWTGQQASQSAAAASDNEATKGFVGDYSGMVGATPIRTPRAPPQEDRVANEIRNIRALTDTQSSLLGGENTPLHTGAGSTGFEGAKPTRHVNATPNPMATPLRSVNGQTNGTSATPIRGAPPGATPLRTPRDTLALNQNDPSASSSTPLSIRSQPQSSSSLRAQLASLPKTATHRMGARTPGRTSRAFHPPPPLQKQKRTPPYATNEPKRSKKRKNKLNSNAARRLCSEDSPALHTSTTAN